MPFIDFNVNEYIEKKISSDVDFKQAWDSSRTEYKTISKLIEARKQQGLSQSQLADLTGNKQQAISRIENRQNSPSLKTFCAIADVLGLDIQLVPKAN